MFCHTLRPAEYIVDYGSGVLHSLQVDHLSAALFLCEGTAVFSGTSSAPQRLFVADFPAAASCVNCLAVLSRTDTFDELCECKRCRNEQVSVLHTIFWPKLYTGAAATFDFAFI